MVTIVICGTPGTGKSTLIERLRKDLPEFAFLNLSQFAIDNDCTSSYDGSLESYVMDEDKLVDKLEPILQEKRYSIVECIHADFLPTDWVNWVYVCRTENTKLYDRLKGRNYNESKLTNNIQAEIFQTIYDEALENFGDSKVTELHNNEIHDLVRNSTIIIDNVKKLMTP